MDRKSRILKRFPLINKYRYSINSIYKNLLWFLRYLPGTSLQFGPPRGIYKNAETYNTANKKDSIKEIVLAEEETVTRKPPATNSKLVLGRFSKYAVAKVIEKKGFVLNKARYVSGNGGTVITMDDKIFLPCSPLKNEWNFAKHQSLYVFKLPKAEIFKKVILIDTRCSQENYYHWLNDHLQRFYWLKKMNLDLIEYTIISSKGEKNYHDYSYEILKLNGFNFKEWISIKDVKHFYADELVIPPYTTPALNGNDISIDLGQPAFFQKMFLRKTDLPELSERIYLSRRKSIRTSPEEKELVGKLSLFGIKEIFLEDHNMSEQAVIVNNAKLIVGFHGAGFTNTYFCKPGTIIVEIFGPDFIVTDYWALSNRLQLQYFAYCEDDHVQNESIYRLARQMPTLINVNNFMIFFKSILPKAIAENAMQN
jgi:capsular polysaccharide biosynthesis protein